MLDLFGFIELAIDVPFVDRGRDYKGWDCWGSVFCGYRDMFGIVVPSYSAEYGSTEDLDGLAVIGAAARQSGDWVEVTSPRTGDLVLLTIARRPCHVGLMVGEKEFLDVRSGVFPSVQPTDSLRWKGPKHDNIEGYYRHVDRP